MFSGYSELDARLLGLRIRQAREQRGLSQEEFAALIKRDQRAVSEYEHGKRRISVTDLPRVAQALDVPILYFFEGDVTATDQDRIILDAFHRLTNMEDRQAAIDILRMFGDAIVRK